MDPEPPTQKGGDLGNRGGALTDRAAVSITLLIEGRLIPSEMEKPHPEVAPLSLTSPQMTKHRASGWINSTVVYL